MTALPSCLMRVCMDQDSSPRRPTLTFTTHWHAVCRLA